ncbi:methyltransferase [Candidatus Woesearchaeota archaeon]|nr:methyltransferase [Candidatus Woesearchaeota archaeon]
MKEIKATSAEGYRDAINHLKRIDKPIEREVLGKKIIVLPGSFDPIFQDSQFLASKLNEIISQNSKVLDMGTGSGIQAIFSSDKASEVVAADINAASVECAEKNVLLHGLKNKIKVLQSDLFENIKDKFDVIIWNPPFYDEEPKDIIEAACGDRENKHLGLFLKQARDYLTKKGFIILIITDSLNYQIFFEFLRIGKMSLELIDSIFNKKNYHIVKLWYRR